MRPPTLGATDLIGGATAECNWPFACFNANMSHIIGQSTDAIVGGGMGTGAAADVSSVFWRSFCFIVLALR